MTTAGPLSGIRVLDVSTGYAAPITAMLLGNYGADVSKVEQPDGGPARTRVPLICAIETAVGVLAAARIAAVAGVENLSMGGVDLRRGLRAGGGMTPSSTSDHTWWSSPALPASHRPSTVSIHSSMTTPGCARRPATRTSSGSSASPPSTPGSCRSCTFFPRPRRTCPGHVRYWRPSMRPGVRRRGCQTGSSSTSRGGAGAAPARPCRAPSDGGDGPAGGLVPSASNAQGRGLRDPYCTGRGT